MRPTQKHLLPLAWLFDGVTRLRNFLYDVGVLPSKRFEFPIICVGNISTGGTGKSPFTMYLLEVLSTEYKLVTLSRGYKRKSKGFVIANYQATASTLGDEPMQFFRRFKNKVVVTVGENRVSAVEQIKERFEFDAIVMDDGLQHRAINPGFKIILTPENNLYTEDYILPAGNLRETSSRAKHAQIVVVTKCERPLATYEEEVYRAKLNLLPEQSLFFARTVYANKLLGWNERILNPAYWKEYNVLLVAGIANPKPLEKKSAEVFGTTEFLRFPDHHAFTTSDLVGISKTFEKLSEPKIILTTEKDFVRLQEMEPSWKENLFFWPIDLEMNDAGKFKQIIRAYVETKGTGNG